MPIGNHVSKNNKNMHDAINYDIIRAKLEGVQMNCGQIFVIGPLKNAETLSAAEKQGIRKLTESGFRLVVHCSYLSNPWSKKGNWGMSIVKQELAICGQIGAEGLILHLAKVPANEIALQIAQIMPNVQNCILYLEIESYHPSNGTYETAEKLQNLANEIKKVVNSADFKKIGVCVDTAHLWAAGNGNVQKYGPMRYFLDELYEIFDNYMIHLNDQKWPLGSGRDEHAPLRYGTIWAPIPDIENTGLAAILDWIKETNNICILERKSDKPKFDGLPAIDNITSDYKIIQSLGHFHNKIE